MTKSFSLSYALLGGFEHAKPGVERKQGKCLLNVDFMYYAVPERFWPGFILPPLLRA
jgi:hypothetical protein